MAELFGREGGVSRGRGGSMHLFDCEKRLMGGYAIVGGQLPLATGAGLAIVRKGEHDVVVCQMGDATTNIGAFHESLNMAALWKLPVVFVDRQQRLRHGHRRSRRARPVAELYEKACAYQHARRRGRRQRRAGRPRRASARPSSAPARRRMPDA